MIVRDNFNRSNETPLAGNWTNPVGYINLTSNQIVGSSDANAGAAWRNSETYTATQVSQFTLVSSGQPTIFGPGVRLQLNGSVVNGYWLLTTATTIAVYVSYGTTPTNEQIGTDLSWTAAGVPVRIAIAGNVITVSVNGSSIGTRTDTNNRVSSGGAPGILLQFTNVIWDDFVTNDGRSPLPIFLSAA